VNVMGGNDFELSVPYSMIDFNSGLFVKADDIY